VAKLLFPATEACGSISNIALQTLPTAVKNIPIKTIKHSAYEDIEVIHTIH